MKNTIKNGDTAMSEKVTEGNALGAKYTVYASTGSVKSTDTRTETEVTGSVSGGAATNTPVTGKVETKITNYQNIFLTDDAGKDHAIELKNFLVPCTVGQEADFYSNLRRAGPPRAPLFKPTTKAQINCTKTIRA